MCHNQFELDWGAKQATTIAEENLIRYAGHGFREAFVQVRQETSVSFSCQRHSLSLSIPCSNSFAGKHSKSTVLHCPTHRLIPTSCRLLILRGPGDTPSSQDSNLYELCVLTLALHQVPTEGFKADRLSCTSAHLTWQHFVSSLSASLHFHCPNKDGEKKEESVRFP